MMEGGVECLVCRCVVNLSVVVGFLAQNTTTTKAQRGFEWNRASGSWVETCEKAADAEASRKCFSVSCLSLKISYRWGISIEVQETSRYDKPIVVNVVISTLMPQKAPEEVVLKSGHEWIRGSFICDSAVEMTHIHYEYTEGSFCVSFVLRDKSCSPSRWY